MLEIKHLYKYSFWWQLIKVNYYIDIGKFREVLCIATILKCSLVNGRTHKSKKIYRCCRNSTTFPQFLQHTNKIFFLLNSFRTCRLPSGEIGVCCPDFILATDIQQSGKAYHI